MGNVTFGVPEDLALSLKQALNCNCFIETGTYKGNTALWAGKNFLKVHTIEFDVDRYNKTRARIVNMIDTSNINLWQGNSKDVLKDVLSDIDEPVIFWLDAHGLWAGNMTPDDEIPIMQELEIILEWQARTQQECSILIDDARLFINPPPVDKGYHPEYWPNINDIIESLDDRYMYSIANDVIAFSTFKGFEIIKKWVNK